MSKLTLFWLRFSLSCSVMMGMLLLGAVYVKAAPDDISEEQESNQGMNNDETSVGDGSTNTIVDSEADISSDTSVVDSITGDLKEWYVNSGLSGSIDELKNSAVDVFSPVLDYLDPFLDSFGTYKDYYSQVQAYVDEFRVSVKEKSENRKDNKKDDLVIIEGDGLTGWLDEYLDSPVTDTGVKLPDGSTLSYNDKKQLGTWLSVISLNRDDNAYKSLRIIRILVGIFFIIYSVVFFICYWVDRFNTLIDISFLSLISFGKFMASVDDEVSTYRGKEKGVKLLNFRSMLCVSLGFLLLGISILSGVLYRLVVWGMSKLSK